MSNSRRYAYNLPWRGVFLGAMCHGGLCIFTACLATKTESIFFVILGGLSVMFGCFALVVLTRRIFFFRVLELTQDSILYPHGFPRTRITRIPYANIVSVKEGALVPNITLCLTTSKGDFEIGAARFSCRENYLGAKDFIQTRATAEMAGQEEADKILAAFPEPFIEPKDWERYRTHLVVSKPLVARLVKASWFAARCLGVFSIPWLLLQAFQLPTLSLVGFLVVCLPVTFFFTVLYWSCAVHPERVTKITVLANGFTVLSGLQTWSHSYLDITGWATVDREFEGRTLHILLLRKLNYKGIAYTRSMAMPDGPTRERFVQILCAKKVPELPGLKPEWE